LSLLVAGSSSTVAAGETITHTFLATGAETFIVAADGHTEWTYPHSTRDGWVLPNGHLLLVLSASEKLPGGAVLEINRRGEKFFEYKGSQAEVNTAQKLPNGNIMLTEAGPKPRLLEVSAEKKLVLEFPLICQNTNYHMESRMARKLANGNYLVPQLLDKVVREYDPTGKVVWEVNTPHWPFTAIRLPNGHTLIDCTYGNLCIEVDAAGKTVWQLSNQDLPKAWIKDACGAQRLPNGNTVIASYGIGAERIKLLEVTPAKKVVWTYTDAREHGIHHFQILDGSGAPLASPPMR
jgi:hypothetical protein